MSEQRTNYSFLTEKDLREIKIWSEIIPTHLTLEEESKTLVIYMDTVDCGFSTVVTASSSVEKIPGDTTRLYESAFNFMQSLADIYGKTFVYEFMTHEESLEAWARDPEKGQRVFNWDSFGERGRDFVAKKIINPSPTGPDVGHGVV